MTTCTGTQTPTCSVRPGSEAIPAPAPAPTTPSCPGTTLQIGQFDIVQTPSGCLSKERVRTSLQDGIYSNAVVTVQDGWITGVEAGAAQVVVLPALCQDGGTSPDPGTSGFTLAGDACNLTHMAGTEVMTSLVVVPGQGISVTGCGTAGDPLVINNEALPEASTGATVESCGYRIVNGLVQEWSNPIVSVTAGDGISVSYNATTCALSISNTKPYTTTAGGTPSTSQAVVPAEVVSVMNLSEASNTDNGNFVDSWHLWGAASTAYKFEQMPVGSGWVSTVTTDAAGHSAGGQNIPPGMYRISRITSSNTIVVSMVPVYPSR